MSKIQNNSEPKIIPPAGVLLLLLRIQTKLRGRTDIISSAIINSPSYWSNSAQILQTIKDLSFDNPTAAVEMLGEDLFNDINAIKEIPKYGKDELCSILFESRRIVFAEGRGYVYAHYSKAKGI